MPEVVLRPAEEEDIAEMLALYAPYVVQTTVSSEYDAPSIEEFTRRLSVVGRNVHLRCTGAAPPRHRRCDLRRAV